MRNHLGKAATRKQIKAAIVSGAIRETGEFKAAERIYDRHLRKLEEIFLV